MRKAIRTLEKQEESWFQIYKRDCRRAFNCKKKKTKTFEIEKDEMPKLDESL